VRAAAAPSDDEEEEEEEEEEEDSDDDDDDEGANPRPAKRRLMDSDEESGDDDDDDDDNDDGAAFAARRAPPRRDGDDSDDDSDGSSFDGGDIEKAQAKLNVMNAAARQHAEEQVKRNLARGAPADADSDEEGNAVERFALPSRDDLEAERAGPPNLPAIHRRLQETVAVLTDFRARRNPYRSRAEYVDVLAQDCADYYGYNRELVDIFMGLFSPAEALAFLEANEQQRPVVIRVNTLKTRRRELAQALVNRGVRLDPVGAWSKVGLKVYESPVPIGATPEYLAGHYMLQAAASFVPVMALDPQPGERVLDMCAAPGGKTSYIAQLMENKGVLVANDVRRDRLTPLYANLSRLGVTCVVVSCMDGRKVPGAAKGYDRILLDAPCTGLGVIARDPSIKTQKGRDDVVRQSHLQKQLILAAVDALDCHSPCGGVLVYSTCSVSVEENEAVVNYVLRKRHVKLVPLFDAAANQEDVGRPGLTAHDHGTFHPSLSLSRRFYPHEHNMDGFFVAKLRKLSNAIPAGADAVDKEEGEGADGDGDGDVDMGEGGLTPAPAAAARRRDKKAGRRGGNDDDDEEEGSGAGGKAASAVRVVSKSTLAPGAATLKRRAVVKPAAAGKKAQAPVLRAAAKPAAAGAAGAPGKPVASKSGGAKGAAGAAAPAAVAAAAAPATNDAASSAAAGKKRKRLPAEAATPAERAMVAQAAATTAGGKAAAPSPAAGNGAGKPKGKKGAAQQAAAPAQEAGSGDEGPDTGAGVVSFLKPGENPFRKKRKAGRRVQEAKSAKSGGGKPAVPGAAKTATG
jgi:ribosomal RNA methyltransferase Nop2